MRSRGLSVKTCLVLHLFLLSSSLALPTSVSDDWSSTGFLEANAELEASMGMAEQNKFRDRREKERQKERAKAEKEKESEEGE